MANRKGCSLLAIAIVFMSLISFGNGDFQQCAASLRNTAVYEGTLNTLLSCANGPNTTWWMARPTSNAANSFDIIKYNDAIAPTLSGLYAINETGLIIRNATVNPTNGPISTAGIYIVLFQPSSNRAAAKLVVVRSAPNCSCNQLDSGQFELSCTIIYADNPSYAINAVMNWTVNGQLYTSTKPTRTLVATDATTLYVWNSTSTITVANTGPATYNCLTTFAPPFPTLSYLANNAPDFTATCTAFCGQTTTELPTTTTQATTTTASSSTVTQQQTTTTSTTPTTSTISTTQTASTISTTPTTPTISTTSTTPTISTTPTTSTISTTSTTPPPTTSASEQTVPTQQITGSPPILLSMKVILSALLGCLLLSTVVCCCWCCQFYPGFCRRRSRPPSYNFVQVDNERIGDDYGFSGSRYALRYPGNSFRYNQPSYYKQAI